jgi:hypothetical protein
MAARRRANTAQASSIQNFKREYTTIGNPIAFSGIDNVRRAKGVDTKDAEDKLAHIFSYSVHREYKKPRFMNPFYIYFFRQQIQVDLIDVSMYHQWNDGIKYIMCCIDVFTKKAWLQTLKNKQAPTSRNAMSKFLDEVGTLPKQIFFDRGK